MLKPFLFDIVNNLYHGVMDNMPQSVQDRDMASAFILGSTGIYGVVKGLQWASKNIMNNFIPCFDEEHLPKLEKICITAITAIPIMYSIMDPNGARQVMIEHPTYTSGMIGVYFGSVAGALQDLHKKSKDMENLVNE